MAEEVCVGAGLGIYGWTTPEMDGFELPETDDPILALHLGGELLKIKKRAPAAPVFF